jgi:predicted adenylyl cyclase CyaB
MTHVNIEIKAKCPDQETIRGILKSLNAKFVGLDHQIDTYFNANKGRLKLREGDIENSLIYYERENKSGPRESNVVLFKTQAGSPLKEILTRSMGIKTVIDKKREIYFVGNVKFHLDNVASLGSFVEIEAIDDDGGTSRGKLLEQCQHYLDLFKINKADLISKSYSDLLLDKAP